MLETVITDGYENDSREYRYLFGQFLLRYDVIIHLFLLNLRSKDHLMANDYNEIAHRKF